MVLPRLSLTGGWCAAGTLLFLVSSAMGATLTGRVVDEDGRPVAGAQIKSSQRLSYVADAPEAVSLDDGSFVLEGIDPELPLSIVAVAGDRMTASPIELAPGELDEVPTIVIRPGAAVVITGRVIDDTGAPLAGLKVDIRETVRWGQQDHTRRAAIPPCVTGDDGVFRSEPTFPGNAFSLRVRAAGHHQVETGSWQSEAGLRMDFGDLVLRVRRGAVDGIVVDAGGQPVTGARVYSRRRAPTVAAASIIEPGWGLQILESLPYDQMPDREKSKWLRACLRLMDLWITPPDGRWRLAVDTRFVTLPN